MTWAKKKIRGLMRNAFIATALLLAGCSNEPVGQSAYFDPWENPQIPSAQDPQLAQINADLEARRLSNARGGVALDGDASLVASLEQAIETAGTQPAPLPGQMAQPGGVPLTALAPAPIAGSGAITDNSFDTVAARETIETDAARLAAQSQAAVVLEAQPLPKRDAGVNPVAFARATTHNIGERIYPRKSRKSASQRCRQYGNPDAAQRAFLAAGGPQEDVLQLDPDGDGFVCGWSPIPFRNLKVGGGT